MFKKIKNICCIGAGYVGGPTMAVIADKCPEINVEVVDINIERIKQWNSEDYEKLPIFEPGLQEIVKRCRGRNLHFSNLIEEKIGNADIIFISVNTPTKTKGVGAGKASDLKWVEACARQVAKYARGHTIVVEKSTLPVRTAEVIRSILDSSQKNNLNDSNNASFDVLSNPEFLSEGTAIMDLNNPDRVLIGGEKKESIDALCEVYKNWVSEDKILKTNVWSSELAKLTSNAFLAQRISSINSISALCEKTGADIREVSRAIGSDSRIGSKFLESGPGFGGSCFKKDILNLVYLSEHFGLPEVAHFWESVVKLNNWHQHRISKLIVKKLFGTVSNKKISILGFSFKADTNDTRESSAITICKDLIEEGAFLKIHDPKVDPRQIAIDLDCDENHNFSREQQSSKNEGWSFHKEIFESTKDVDAVVVLTEWEEYKNIDWKLISKVMRKPSWVFDARSILNSKEVSSSGLNFWRLGKGS
ncbi:nucleotide sugar dehydrogenase [Prochlorococcus sp. AH-736-L15]|nr:nucleotide sugar dehydrogenase [Prochlorococcus sp. AH-736-L15]MDA9741682.1 nucleotide sugar dehydrogenase [Prochlorococcus sp. AH-736-L15]